MQAHSNLPLAQMPDFAQKPDRLVLTFGARHDNGRLATLLEDSAVGQRSSLSRGGAAGTPAIQVTDALEPERRNSVTVASAEFRRSATEENSLVAQIELSNLQRGTDGWPTTRFRKCRPRRGCMAASTSLSMNSYFLGHEHQSQRIRAKTSKGKIEIARTRIKGGMLRRVEPRTPNRRGASSFADHISIAGK